MVKIARQLDLNQEPGGSNKPLGSLWDANSFNGLGDVPPTKTEEELLAEKAIEDKKKLEGAPTAETIKVETTELNTLLEKDEATLTDVEKTRLADLKVKYDVVETDEDGKPLTDEAKKAIKATNDRLKAISTKPENQRTAEETQFLKDNTPAPKKSLYEQVDELNGIALEVDYQGKDPLSPEGVIIREEAIANAAVEDYDAQLKEKFPRAYKFLTHLQAGGKEEDFFNIANNDFSQVNLSKTDVAGQEAVYRQALAIKGISPEQIDTLVTTAKDKGKLFDQSKIELEALQAKQKADEAKLETQKEQAIAAEEKTVKGFLGALEQSIAKGINGIQIPKADVQAFTRFMASNVYYENGQMIRVTRLDPATLMEELAAGYFRFKKGDLSKVVANKASNQRAEEVRKKITYKITPKGSNHQEGTEKIMPLGQI